MSTTDQIPGSELPPPRAADRAGFVKFRDELMAGGSSDAPGPEETAGGSRAVLGLGVIALALLALALWSLWAFLFVVLLLVCVFLHELGHFLAARATGMKATQFFLFMGPKLWSFRRGETEYGVRLYPVGAFVRIIGMNSMDEVDPADEARAYRSKSYPRRMLTITAGSLMHVLIAIALVFGVYAVKGQREETGRVGFGGVEATGPAAAAGVREGDIVLAIDGTTVEEPEEFVATIRSYEPGDTVQLLLERDGEQLTIPVGLGNHPDPSLAGVAYLGTRSGSETEWQEMGLGEAARRSVTDLASGTWETARSIVRVVNPSNIVDHLVSEDADPETRPGTVVGATKYSDFFGGQDGLAGVLLVLASVNISLGVINMFPLLPLDGGHAAIATYERIRSRRGRRYHADVSKMVPVAVTTMAFLVFLMLAGLYLDVARPLR
jgi:membrane-associated protease RseP (regulator of RpoE activity)